MKRVLLLTLALMLVVTINAMAKGGAAAEPEPEGAREVLVVEVLNTISKDRLADPEKSAPAEDYILKRFGLTYEGPTVPEGEAEDKLALMFASGDEPYLLRPYRDDVFKYAREGFLYAMSDHLDKVPNYRKLWPEKEWDLLLAFNKAFDGKLYCLPEQGWISCGTSWIYRKGAFDRMGLTFPSTIDEHYETVKKIKAAHPESLPIASRWGVGWAISGFLHSYRTHNGWFVDPDVNDLVFGPTTEKYRDALKYSNKLYRENLIEQEMATITGQQWTEKFAKGLAYMQWEWTVRYMWANTVMESVDPEANWTWPETFITAYPGKPALVDRILPFQAAGWVITKRCPPEIRDRLLELLDWSCTEEGTIFHEFGIEGLTFKYEDGKPVYMDHMYSVKNPEGEQLWQYGLSYPLKRNLDAVVQHSGTLEGTYYGFELEKLTKDMPYLIEPNLIAWGFTEEQIEELADPETMMGDVVGEYEAKFVMGLLDPSDDSDWADFQEDLKKAGLEKSSKIRKEIFKTAVYKLD